MKLLDLQGRQFGRLSVLCRLPDKRWGRIHWVCFCDCGNIKAVSSKHLLSGATKSCGCYRNEVTASRTSTHNKSNTKYYRVWYGLLSRCLITTNPAYPNYGGRGITVCDRWLDFENFYADMGHAPDDAYELDRINNEGPYSPENCRWVTRKLQSRNRRSNRFITLGGRTLCVSDWEYLLGFKKGVIFSRLSRGWPIQKALTTPTGTENCPLRNRGMR